MRINISYIYQNEMINITIILDKVQEYRSIKDHLLLCTTNLTNLNAGEGGKPVNKFKNHELHTHTHIYIIFDKEKKDLHEVHNNHEILLFGI